MSVIGRDQADDLPAPRIDIGGREYVTAENYDALWREVVALRVATDQGAVEDRDKLREALEQIVKLHTSGQQWSAVGVMATEIAADALGLEPPGMTQPEAQDQTGATE